MPGPLCDQTERARIGLALEPWQSQRSVNTVSIPSCYFQSEHSDVTQLIPSTIPPKHQGDHTKLCTPPSESEYH
ncbi:hypothetical protein NQZ68_012972 [Dissostichus eleginoides]|nr:hypothetical protein NQZ68_012972 [Dissostichus eleginoides]